MITNTGLISCVKIGECAKIEGALLLENGSINSNVNDPVYIGHGSYCKDFIICSGARIDSGTTIEKCFVGQSTILSRNYSAEHSLFFSNCHGQNGEAAAITAKDICTIVEKWREAVVGLDNLLYEDARKEFSLSAMTGFGADGNHQECLMDFEQVRGIFESNKFVSAVKKHIEEKNQLGDELLSRITHLAD